MSTESAVKLWYALTVAFTAFAALLALAGGIFGVVALRYHHQLDVESSPDQDPKPSCHGGAVHRCRKSHPRSRVVGIVLVSSLPLHARAGSRLSVPC